MKNTIRATALMLGMMGLASCGAATSAPDHTDEEPGIRLDITAADPQVTEPSGDTVLLSPLDDSTPELMLYRGLLSTGEPVNVELLRALPRNIDPSTDLPTLPPEAQVAVEGNPAVTSESSEIIIGSVDAADLTPLLATAATTQVVVITVPEDVKIDSSTVKASTAEAPTPSTKVVSPHSLQVHGLRAQQDYTVHLILEEDGAASEATVPLRLADKATD
jgi:hypothetical protein